jgi:hypothetical protein
LEKTLLSGLFETNTVSIVSAGRQASKNRNIFLINFFPGKEKEKNLIKKNKNLSIFRFSVARRDSRYPRSFKKNE